jgi:hypothetical protein
MAHVTQIQEESKAFINISFIWIYRLKFLSAENPFFRLKYLLYFINPVKL